MPDSVARPQLSEKQFMQQVITLARYSGWKVFHPHDSRRSEPGWPDLVLARPPQVLFVELKTSSGRPTPAQLEWLDVLSECTEPNATLWRPEDWEHIRRTLQRSFLQGLEELSS